MSKIKIKWRKNSFEYDNGITLNEIKKDFQKHYKYEILVGAVDNKLVPMSTEITKNSKVSFYDISTNLGNISYKKGLQFLFSKAVKDELNCDVRITNCIDNAIYIDILSNDILSDVAIQKIKIRMKKLVDEKHSITKIMVSRLDAMDYYKRVNRVDKANSLRYISNSTISLYKMDDMLDYYYGVLPDNTSLLAYFNIKYLGNNKVALLYPNRFSLGTELKFNKNEKLINAMDFNETFLKGLHISSSVDVNELVSKGKYGEIIRLSESLQNNRLLEIAANISKNRNTKVVLMTGPSSSGKTTTAKKLALFLKMYGLDPIPISIDDFFLPLKDRELNEKGEPEMERISAIDTNLFNKKISELLAGNSVKLPRFNFILSKQEISNAPVKMNENSVLLIEGIHAFNEKLTEMIPDKSKYKIFIYPLTPINIDNHNLFSSDDNRLLRRIVRDHRTRNMSALDSIRKWKDVLKAERETIYPYIKDADEVINTYLLYELGVLKTYVEPLLFSVNEEDDKYEEAIRLINLFRIILSIPSEEVPIDSIIREFIGGSCFNEE